MAQRGRPKGTGKAPGEKYVLRAFKFPPELWEAFARAVPSSKRSETIRGYMEKEIRKKIRGGREGPIDTAGGLRPLIE